MGVQRHEEPLLVCEDIAMTTDTASFTLSQEEVYYLLNQVHARGLLGVDSAPLATFDAEQRRAVLAAAARGELDLNRLAREEMASRGLDLDGNWVGFKRAAEIHQVHAS